MQAAWKRGEKNPNIFELKFIHNMLACFANSVVHLRNHFGFGRERAAISFFLGQGNKS
jgi:hypothetical protein